MSLNIVGEQLLINHHTSVSPLILNISVCELVGDVRPKIVTFVSLELVEFLMPTERPVSTNQIPSFSMASSIESDAVH